MPNESWNEDDFNVAIYDLQTNRWPDTEQITGFASGVSGQIEFWRSELTLRIEQGRADAIVKLAELEAYIASEGLK